MKKVMIVDDNYLSAEGIEKNIDWESLNAEIIYICYNGSSALQAMRENPVDLIISDIEMPDLDGISMSREALKINPCVKIILISAFDKFEYARRALLLGALDYIEKPLDYNYLIQKVKKAFSLMEREERNRQLLKQSSPLMVEKFFRELTRSSRREARFRLGSYLEYLNLNLNYTFYNVVAIELENTQQLKNVCTPEQYQMELLNIHDTLVEYCSVFSYAYILQDFDNYLCILGHDVTQQNHFLQLTYQTISEAIEDLNSCNIILNAGIGTVVQDFWSLKRSCDAAVHALEYRFFFPHKNIFDGRDALGRELSATDFSEGKEEELIRLFCKKDKVSIHLWLQEYSAYLMETFQSRSSAFIQIYSLLGRILKFFYELRLDTGDLEAKIIRVYNNLEQFHTAEELCSWLEELSSLVCQKLDSAQNNYHEKLCTSVIAFVSENYSSNTLCLNDIAAYANVSPAYLSSLFKKNQGISLSDFITAQRIQAAQRLLSTSDMSLKEISLKCGYANQYYFSTSFKKKMGISPSVYREEHGIVS